MLPVGKGGRSRRAPAAQTIARRLDAHAVSAALQDQATRASWSLYRDRSMQRSIAHERLVRCRAWARTQRGRARGSSRRAVAARTIEQ